MADIVLPLTLTDLAKALKELLGATRDITQGVSSVVEIRKRSKHRKAAKGLSALRFVPGGFLATLRHLTTGKNTEEHLRSISSNLNSTAMDVQFVILSLEKYADLLRETVGLAALERLEHIMDHQDFGKRVVRIRLHQLRRLEPDDPSIGRICSDLIRDIERLNSEIRELHDLIIPQTKS